MEQQTTIQTRTGRFSTRDHRLSRFKEVIARAVLQSQTSRTRSLLRISIALPSFDPIEWARTIEAFGRPVFVLHDGAASRTLVAVDTVYEADFSGSSRFGIAQNHCLQASKQLIEDHEIQSAEALPLLVVGFAFSPTPHTQDTTWKNWPRAFVRIPRILIQSAQRGSTSETIAAITLSVSPSVSEQELLSTLQRDIDGLTKPLEKKVDHNYHEAQWFEEESSSSYQHTLQAAISATQKTSGHKIVVARCQQWVAPNKTPFDPIATIERLRQRHPRHFTFGLGRPHFGFFLGATPEKLFSMQNGRWQTHAVAGTVARGKNLAEDTELAKALLASIKDRNEHAVVVRAIANAMAPISSELRVAAEPELLRLAEVQHLESSISGTVRQPWGALSVVERLHPTPAVGGWPTPEALQWLAQNECLDRGYYAGTLGVLDRFGNGTFMVCIRSALLFSDRVFAYAGGGIVAGSDPERETAETALKLQTVRKCLMQRVDEKVP